MLSRDELLFRRQFVIGPGAVRPSRFWSTTKLLHGLTLSAHRDLPCALRLDSDTAIALLGRAVHVKQPRWTEAEIVDHLRDDAGDLRAFSASLDGLAGRWVAVLQSGGRTYLQTDACGFRQVHYATADGATWAASQPALLDTVVRLRPNDDPELREFLQCPAYAALESAWVGDATTYRDCHRLLPNHWLDLGAATTRRRSLARRPVPLSRGAAVDASAAMLQSIMAGICARERVSLALTAGIDSRILLAAAKPVVQGIDLFVDRMGGLDDDDADIWVPRELCRRLGLPFDVRNSAVDPPDWFRSLLATNVTAARVLPKTRSIFAKLAAGDACLNINGNGGEIGRNFYDKYAQERPRPWSAAELAELMGYRPAPRFVIHALERWLQELGPFDRDGWMLPDLLYWEQRMGIWGAQYPAEQDVAVDEFSPFNCRALLETMVAAPRKDRAAPRYPFFRDLMVAMWPEVLELPLNPLRSGDHLNRAKQWLRPYVPYKAVRWAKRLAQ
jgi:hypothetical protein